jgi:hypothetical protein
MDHKGMQKNSRKILLTAIITVGLVFGLVGCTSNANTENLKNSVNYNGIEYVIQANIGLDFAGYQNVNTGLEKMCKKIGSFRQADVYQIKGLEQKDWILLENNSMISSDDPAGGIYHSAKVKMDTITDFKPVSLKINYLTPPTSEQSGSEKQIFDTADTKVIEKIVTAIEKGKNVSAEKQAEVTKAMLEGDRGYQNYRLEFFSESYPKLVYRISYAEDDQGKFYIGYYEELNLFKIIEIDNTIHEYLSPKTGLTKIFPFL